MLLALALTLACAQEEHRLGDPGVALSDPLTKVQTSYVRQWLEPRQRVKLSPKAFGTPPDHWSFPWLVNGYGIVNGNAVERVRVYSQDRPLKDDPAPKVARMQMRLWEYCFNVLHIDHSEVFYRGDVFTYLCKGGRPGGEHLFDNDTQRDFDRGNEGDDQFHPKFEKVNTIYLYDLSTFSNPIEMAREVAHEYGHATIPPVGGFSEPEYWANGYLGEKLYMRHMYQYMVQGRLSPDDAMGATQPQLKSWLSTNVDPLIEHAALSGPESMLLRDRGKEGMDAYIGLALYADTILPEAAFSRSMQMTSEVKDYPEAIVLAAEEPDKYRLNIPGYLIAKPIWIPLGKAKLFGTTILRRSGDWALIRPGTVPITVVPRHSDD